MRTTQDTVVAPGGTDVPDALPVRLSAVVLTTPARMRHAEAMRDRHPELDLRIVVDPAPGVGPNALQRAYRTAWAAVAPQATHHLVVEDDTLLCRRFRDHLELAITARPDQAISLYTEWGSGTSYAVRLATMLGAAWADAVDDYVSTQALVLPADLARNFSRSGPFGGPLYDFDMRLFLASAGVPAYVPVPNLAEDARLPSVTGHGFLGERVSACFLDDVPGAVDWFAATPAPGTLPVFTFGAGTACSIVRPDQPGRPWRLLPQPFPPKSALPATAIADLARTTIRQMPAATGSIGRRLPLALWHTGYGLGLAAAELTGVAGVDPESMLARPLVRRALDTMPDGAFRFLVDDDERIEHHNALVQMVHTAVHQGYRTYRPTQETP